MFTVCKIWFTFVLLSNQIYTQSMIVNEETLNNWKILKQHGDYKEIAKMGKDAGDDINDHQVARVFRKGTGSELVLKHIRLFYENRSQRVSETAQK